MGQAADELREDIERTRDDMATTVDAIGERLSPKVQAERQMDRLREKGIDPKRAALIAGAVLVMLMLVRRGRGHRDG